MRVGTLVALVALAAYAAPVRALVCPVRDTAVTVVAEGCPTNMPIYTPTNAGDDTDPVEGQLGCPFEININPDEDEAIYLKFNRSSNERLYYEWSYPHADTMAMFAGFNHGNGVLAPHYRPTAGEASYEFYWWPAASADSRVWYEDATTWYDIYHNTYNAIAYCGSARPNATADPCIGDDDITQNTGFLYMTWAGALISSVQYDNVHIVDFLTPGWYIDQVQLNAVKDLYYENCYNTQADLPVFPDGTFWERDEHIKGTYRMKEFAYDNIFSTDGNEKDTDLVPYCDWLYGEDIEGYTTNDCEAIDGVFCDPSGNVAEIQLAERGLSGKLPDSFSDFTKLVKLHLGSNALSGTIPSSLYQSRYLETLSIGKNFFTGPIPCPEHSEPELQTLYLYKNDLTGTLPACIFTDAPSIKYVDLSYLNLDSTIPAGIKQATELVSLTLRHTGLYGTIPEEVTCLNTVSFFQLSRNSLTGSIPQSVINGMTAIYSLDLMNNELTGPVPHIFTNHTQLKRIYLEGNFLSDSFTTQLTEFADNQAEGALSEVYLGYNNLHGELPSVFYDLMTNANSISTLDATGNNYRCDKDLLDWPAWVERMGSGAFGKCKKVPSITSVKTEGADLEAYVGEQITVKGADFHGTDELKCKFGSTTALATHVSETEILCTVPEDLVKGDVKAITVANYGEDYWAAATSNSFETIEITIVEEPEDDDELSMAAIVGIAVAVIVAIICTIATITLIVKEKKGEPIFTPIATHKQSTEIKIGGNPSIA